jgi:tetratricopeptide (TPR) repeat protein
VARRRLPVAIATAFLLVIVGGLAASLTFWQQAAYQRDRAAQAEAAATAEARRAYASAQRSQTTYEFLRDTLATVDPARMGREVRVADLLANAANRLNAAFSVDSVELAELEDVLGRAYQALGLYDEAEPHRARALEVRRRVLGDMHPDTLSSLEAVGELHELQRRGEVLPFVKTAFDGRRHVLGPDDPDTLHSMNYLAFLYRRAGNLPQAEELQLEALRRLRQVRGENDRETLSCLANLAWLRESQGRLGDSAALFREALDRACAALGEADPDTMDVRDHCGRILRELGRLEECEATFRHNLELRRSVNGSEHPETLAAASNLAVVLHIRGQLTEAETLQRDAIAVRKRVERPNFPDILFSLVSLTNILIDSARPVEAIDVAQEAVALSAQLDNPDRFHRSNAVRALGAALLATGDATAAEPWLREAWEFWKLAPLSDRRRRLAESDLGACLTQLGNLEEAEPLLVESNRLIQADPGVSELTRERSLERLSRIHASQPTAPAAGS